MNKATIGIKGKASGHFTFERIRGGHVVETVAFDNLITDTGLLKMGTSSNLELLTGLCYVGTGSGAPLPTDTVLGSQIAVRGSPTLSRGLTSSEPYYLWARAVFTFGVGAAAGNISEVGVGSNDGSGLLNSRALVVDDQGNPTTITVLSDEQLRVTYEHRHFPMTDDVTGQFTLTGNLGGTYDFIARPSQITTQGEGNNWGWSMRKDLSFGASTNFGAVNQAYSGDIRGITSFPLGTSSSASSGSSQILSGGTSCRFVKAFNLGSGNLAGGIRSLRVAMGLGIIQIQIDPPIPKTANDLLEIQIEHEWGRA